MVKTRLWLIPLWLVAQGIWIRVEVGSWLDTLTLMTSAEHLWITFVVIAVIVLYASKYRVEYGKDATKKNQNMN
jgi:hypothetical protein